MANRFFPNYDQYKITSKYGMRTLNGVTKMHNGIDLVAKNSRGNSATDYVTAHTGGKVVGVGFSESAGNFIRIKVSDNATMVYYHFKTMPDFKKGDTVKQGQRLAYMGSTGNSTGAHLHWGIEVDGKWIDPTPYLDADFVQEVKTVEVELPVLKKGAKREEVKTLQRLLAALGYDIGSTGADGSFGKKTDAAVRAFQEAESLEADGSVGRKTWTKLLVGK